MFRNDSLEFHRVIGELRVDELQSVRSRYHDDLVAAFNEPPLLELPKRDQSDPRVWTVEQPGPIGSRTFFHDLCFRGLFDDTVITTQGVDRFVVGHRVPDLDRRGDGGSSRDRLKNLEVALIGEVERIGGLRLPDANARSL